MQDLRKKVLDVGTVLHPLAAGNGLVLLGQAIIIEVVPTHPEIVTFMTNNYKKYSYQSIINSYKVMTDFGSRMTCTISEIEALYHVGLVVDVKERYERQKELLREFEEELSMKEEGIL